MPDATDPKVEDKDKTESEDSGDGGTGDPKETPEAGTDPKDESSKSERTFSQEDVNRIVKRETAKLEPDAAAWKKHKQESATEEERRAEEQREKDERIAERERKANERLLRASIIEAARSANIDAEFEDLVIEALMRSDSVEVDEDGEVKGVDRAIKKLVAEKPKLVAKKRAPGQSGAEFGGQESETLDEQIAAAEAKGDWKLSRRLKLQKISQST